MSSNPASSTHPCYSEMAHRYFSRIHLPVAARCNIQCNYCNRKYDCANENRPGVTSRLLSPEEAWQRVAEIAARRRDLAVVGIAGPGDALANPEATFRTLHLIRWTFPDLALCLSTNGLELVNRIDELIAAGVSHLTVTVNTMFPDTAAQIYSKVTLDGKPRRDKAAFAEFLSLQQQGIQEAIRAKIQVKVNSLLLPGINDTELISLSKRLKLMGVTLHNIMPLIAKPEHGSLFGKRQQPMPTHQHLEALRTSCGEMRQMAHCRQCRADAVGKLGEETAPLGESVNAGWETIAADFGLEKREQWRLLVNRMLSRPSSTAFPEDDAQHVACATGKVAVCTRGTGFADQDLALARELHIYQIVKGKALLVNIRRIEIEAGTDWFEALQQASAGCRAILSSKFGYDLFLKLEACGIMPIADLSHLPVEQAVLVAASRIESEMQLPETFGTLCADYK